MITLRTDVQRNDNASLNLDFLISLGLNCTWYSCMLHSAKALVTGLMSFSIYKDVVAACSMHSVRFISSSTEEGLKHEVYLYPRLLRIQKNSSK